MLNGQKAIAELDSGAYTSVVTSGMAERAAAKTQFEDVRSASVSTGFAGKAVPTSIAVFPTFAIGDEAINNAKLRIADLFHADTKMQIGSLIPQRMVDSPDMLLGADFIRAHRIYIARSQGKIYFSYNGGPIFQVITPRVSDPVTAPETSAPVKP
jgi:hypothetical protein